MLYAPLLSESEERIEAKRCWAGSRTGAINGVFDGTCDWQRSDALRRRALSRGGMMCGLRDEMRVWGGSVVMDWKVWDDE